MMTRDDVNPVPIIIHQDKSFLQITFPNTFRCCLRMPMRINMYLFGLRLRQFHGTLLSSLRSEHLNTLRVVSSITFLFHTFFFKKLNSISNKMNEQKRDSCTRVSFSASNLFLIKFPIIIPFFPWSQLNNSHNQLKHL